MTETRTTARPMSEREKAQARADYLADRTVTVERLADEYGVSRSAMLRALRGVTRPVGGQVLTRLSDTQMRKLRDEGLSLSQIAAQAGISRQQVSRRLRGITH